MSGAVFTDKTTVDPRYPFPARELGGSPFAGCGLKGSVGFAIDGAKCDSGNLWVTTQARVFSR